MLVRSWPQIPHGSARLTLESFCLSLEAREVAERLQGLEPREQPRLAVLVAFSILHVKGQIAFFVLVLVVLVVLLVCPPEALGQEPQSPEVCLLLPAILRAEALGHH